MLSPDKITPENIIILVHYIGVGNEDVGPMADRIKNYTAKLYLSNQQFENLYIKHFILPRRDLTHGAVEIESVYPNRDVKTLPTDMMEMLKESDKFIESLFTK